MTEPFGTFQYAFMLIFGIFLMPIVWLGELIGVDIIAEFFDFIDIVLITIADTVVALGLM